MAAPHVAGVAALLKSHDPNMLPSRVEDLLTSTANNSNSNSASSNRTDPITGEYESTTITLSTLKNFDDSQFNERLIGSLSGNLKTRKSTIKDLRKTMRKDEGIEYIETIEATQKNFVLLDLSDKNQLSKLDILEGWLRSNEFDYFEIDTRISLI